MADQVTIEQGSSAIAGGFREGTTPDLTRDWENFADPESDAAYFQAWLNLTCGELQGAEMAILLMRDENSAQLMPICLWPDDETNVEALRQVAEEALNAQEARELESDEQGLWYIGWPVMADDEATGGNVAALLAVQLRTKGGVARQKVRQHILWSIGWLQAQLWRSLSAMYEDKIERAAFGLDLVALAEDHSKLEPAAMAVTDLLRQSFGAARVSLGIYDKASGGARIVAASDTHWFDRHTQEVVACERAMDEALDQNCALNWPEEEGDAHILAATATFARATGAAEVATNIMFNQAEPIGALTFEYGASLDEAEPAEASQNHSRFVGQERQIAAEAVAALLGPVIAAKARDRRWLSGRLVDAVEEAWRSVVGNKRPLVKAIAAGLSIFLIGAAFIKTDFRVAADAVLEGAVQRAAVAPFDGFVASGPKRAGDKVAAGDVLATLDDRDILLEVQNWRSERAKLVRQRQRAVAVADRAEAALLMAQIRQADAQLNLAQQKLDRMQIRAPLDGVVLTGDLTQRLGSPVEQGDVLFEIAPLDAYRIVLKVPEGDIRYLKEGQAGGLVLSGLTGYAVPFAVTRITSVAGVEEGENVFRVEARVDESDGADDLSQTRPNLRPGMQGVGKIEVGRKSFLFVWTRSLVDWVRVFLWTWLP